MIREATSAELIKIWDSSQKLNKIFTSFNNFNLYYRKQRRSVFTSVEHGEMKGSAVIGFWRDQDDTIAVWDLCAPQEDVSEWIKYIKKEVNSLGANTLAVIDPPIELIDMLLESDFKLFQSVNMLQCQEISVEKITEVAQLRRIGKEDYSIVLEIDDECFLGFWKLSDNLIRRIVSDLSKKVYAYMAMYEGKNVGYVMGNANVNEGNIARIAVLPDFQGLGIGRQLLATVLREMQADRVQKVNIHTQLDNEKAKTLYKNFGFYETGLGFDIYLADI
ncbi:MAG: GNAT family N-acetyltransferase [Actinobacteria bacterium]|nr:GNAT family N-acetyltransferase [Actinomycetota bacterium]